MQFLSVGSHFCTPASFRQFLAGLPLPWARGYPRRMRQVGYYHRGLSPHQFMLYVGRTPVVQEGRAKSGAPLDFALGGTTYVNGTARNRDV